MEITDQIDPVKRKIIDLAYYAFNQKGYKTVSMDLVSRELRISKKTIYKHFHSKEEILETAMLELFSEVEQRVSLLKGGLSVRHVVMGFFTTFKYFRQGFSRRLRGDVAEFMPHLKDRIENFENQVLRQQFASWLKSNRKAGLLDYPSPTRDLANVFFDMMAGISDAPEDKAEFLLLSLLKGMAVKKKKKKA